MLCGDECESVCDVLWECPAYSTVRADLLQIMHKYLGVIAGC